MARLSSNLYKLARATNTAEVLASGDPKRINRRVRNILIGRMLGRAGVWGRLWR